MREIFRRFAHKTGEMIGSPLAFSTALLIVFAWAIVGPSFGFSATWQLFINTMTTVVTFLTVFLIQNTQNRDSKAVHLKLDELIRTQSRASNDFVAVEEMSDEELDERLKKFELLKSHYTSALEKRRAKRQNNK